MRNWLALFVVAAGVAFATPAMAGDTALADRLFKEGQDLLRTGRVTEACVKFEKSFAEESQLGTLLNLAFCHEKASRPGKAWIEYRDAETRAVATGNKDRARFARERMTEVEKELTRIRIDGAPVKEVHVDGDHVARVENGDSFYVEPGLRKFRFVDKDKHFVVRDVHITKSPFIQPVRAPVPNENTPVDPKANAPAKDAATASSSPWPWVAFGTAAVGLGVAATLGLLALDKADAANIATADKKNNEAADLKSSAQSLALIADIGWGVAAAGTVTGIVLLMYSPSPAPSVGSQSGVKLQFTGTGATLRATF